MQSLVMFSNHPESISSQNLALLKKSHTVFLESINIDPFAVAEKKAIWAKTKSENCQQEDTFCDV